MTAVTDSEGQAPPPEEPEELEEPEEKAPREFRFDPVSEETEAAVAAARRLVVSLLDGHKMPAEQVAGLARTLNELADQAESQREEPGPPPAESSDETGDGTWRKRPRIEAALRNPVNGRQNAFAPDMRARGLADGSVAADVTVGPLYEGPPGYVHGGVSALLLDHLFGNANYWAGTVGPTAKLTLRYRRPVPLDTPLTMRARQERQDGRKLWTTGTIEADGKVCVEAEGLFIAVTDFGVHSDG